MGPLELSPAQSYPLFMTHDKCQVGKQNLIILASLQRRYSEPVELRGRSRGQQLVSYM